MGGRGLGSSEPLRAKRPGSGSQESEPGRLADEKERQMTYTHATLTKAIRRFPASLGGYSVTVPAGKVVTAIREYADGSISATTWPTLAAWGEHGISEDSFIVPADGFVPVRDERLSWDGEEIS